LYQNVFSHLIRIYWIFQVHKPHLGLGLCPLDQRSYRLLQFIGSFFQVHKP
jgi:hypothetical protein